MGLCAHGSTLPDHVGAELPEYQGKPVRHLCAACAYAQGIDEGKRQATAQALTVVELHKARNVRLREALAAHAEDTLHAITTLEALREAFARVQPLLATLGQPIDD